MSQNVENTVVPVHVTQAYRRNTDITTLILNLRATRRWVVKITSLPDLRPEKYPGTHWICLVGPQRLSGHYGEEKNLLPLPCLSLITIRTKVSRLPDGNGTLNCIYIYIYIYIYYNAMNFLYGSAKPPEQLWDPTSLLFNDRSSSPRVKQPRC